MSKALEPVAKFDEALQDLEPLLQRLTSTDPATLRSQVWHELVCEASFPPLPFSFLLLTVGDGVGVCMCCFVRQLSDLEAAKLDMTVAYTWVECNVSA